MAIPTGTLQRGAARRHHVPVSGHSSPWEGEQGPWSILRILRCFGKATGWHRKVLQPNIQDYWVWGWGGFLDQVQKEQEIPYVTLSTFSLQVTTAFCSLWEEKQPPLAVKDLHYYLWLLHWLDWKMSNFYHTWSEMAQFGLCLFLNIYRTDNCMDPRSQTQHCDVSFDLWCQVKGEKKES